MRIIVILLFTLSFHFAYSSKWKMYSIVDTIPIKKSTNTDKLYKELVKWYEKATQAKLVRLNPSMKIIEGKGYFVYYNHIIIENIFLSPRAAERTTGSITYSIKITVQDSIVVTECSNFVHQAYYSQYGEISFGSITDYETVPPGKCSENELWCNAVWSDMKAKAQFEIVSKLSNIVPSMNIRKEGKAYKTSETDEAPAPVEEEKDDYLNLENYLIKE